MVIPFDFTNLVAPRKLSLAYIGTDSSTAQRVVHYVRVGDKNEAAPQQWLARSVEAGKQAYAEAAMTNPSEFGELDT